MSEISTAAARPCSPAWRRLTGWMLAGYWLVLFAATHVPIPKPLAPPQGTDKVIHLTAYGVLALLTAAAWSSRWRLRWWGYLAIFLGLSSFGAFDEITQPLVNRTCDGIDWISDVGGVALGLVVFAILRSLNQLRAANAGE